MIKPILLMVCVVALSGCQYFTTQSPTVNQDQAAPVDDSVTGSVTGTLRDLMIGNRSVMCTYETQLEDQVSRGTVYVTEGKVRGEFVVDATNSYMISDGEYSYIWGDSYDTGMKMAMIDLESSATPVPQATDTPASFDYDQEVDYDCQPWRVDQSYFVPPADVEFVDYTQMLQSIPALTTPAAPGAGTNTACAACDSLSGDMKTQCLTALSCE